jgi:TldD protein
LSLQTAERTLLAPFDLQAQKLERVFGTLAARKVDYADLYFQYSRYEGWSLEEGIVKSGSFNIEQGVGVRAISGEKTAFAYSDEISLQALQDAAKATRAIAAAGQSKRVKAVARRTPVQLYRDVDPIASLPSESKVQLLQRLEQKCRALDPRITQVMASLGGEYEVVLIARADGVISADVRPLVRLSVQVIAEQAGRRESGTGGGGGRTDYSHFTDEALDGYARQAVSQALTNLEARPAPAGTMTVVLGPRMPSCPCG